MDQGEALAQIRRAVEALERVERAPAPLDLSGQDVIAIPFYFTTNKARNEVTRRVFRHLRRVADEVGARVIGVGSEGKVSRSLWCEVFDEVDYHEYPQTWTRVTGAGSPQLRAKFDETVRRARVFNPRRVFIGGSDDVIPVEWWREAWKSEADLVGVSGGARIVRLHQTRPIASTVADWGGTYGWAPEVEFCGGGIVLGRDLLDAWNWAPFSEPNCEIGVEKRAREEHWIVEAIEGRYWSIKVPQAVLNEASRATRAGAVAVNAQAAWTELWESLA